MSGTPALLPAHRLLDLYRRKEVSPLEAVEDALSRIRRYDAGINAFCLVDPEQARADAKESEARWRRGEPKGLLDGVPVSIKDVLLTKGWPTLRGSRLVAADQDWNEDAPAVARLREHGAILLGKTTTPEFHWKTVTDSPLTGITRNPWDPELTPGGSCGGAAAAVALGMGSAAIGTDGGGSIRVPCAFCGLFGLKPTYGRVPLYPPSPFGTLAHVGPMTRSAADAAILLSVISGPDARDPHALPPDHRRYDSDLEAGVRGLRIAFSPDLGHARVDPEVADLVTRGVHGFVELGAIVEEVDPRLPDPREIFETHWYTGLAYLIRRFGSEQREAMDPGLVAAAEWGERVGVMDYLSAVRARDEVCLRMSLLHRDFDLLITPTMPITAFPVGRDVPDPATQTRWTEWTPFTYPFNLTRQPAATVPCGLTPAGLPVGLQIVGPVYGDATVLRASRAFERLHPVTLPPLATG